MGLNEERIQEYLKIFAFPRLSGTIHEDRAFTLAKEEIKKLNLPLETQSFKFSTFYSRIYPKIAFPTALWIIFTLYLNLSGIFVSLSLIITFLFFLPFFILTRNPENIRIGKVLDSQNLYIKLSGQKSKEMEGDKTNNVKNIFFIAHLDSKGQRVTVRLRFISIFFFIISLLACVIIILLKNIILPQLARLFYYIGAFPLAVNLITLAILALNTINNQSKGVIDNASGVACVLELMDYYSQPPNTEKLKKLNLWFVLTGAEETGTMGIRYFYKKLKQVDPRRTIVNNFESLGKKSVGIFIGKNNLENNPDYLKLFRSHAKKRGFFTYISRINRGVHTDGIYLFRKKFNLFEFGSPEAGQYMHSKYDSLENVDAHLLKELCEFIVEQVKFFEIKS